MLTKMPLEILNMSQVIITDQVVLKSAKKALESKPFNC